MEEFNILTDLYLPQVKQDDIYNSKEYKHLKKNNIDTAEIEGIDKDPDAGEIVFDVDKEISDADKDIFLKDIYNFILKDLPRDTLISVVRGGTEGFQFVNNFTAAIGINPDDTNEFINEKLDKAKTHLDTLDKDSPLVSKLIAMAGQDAAYTIPIYNKLKRAKVPMGWRMPIAFALGGALAFDKEHSLLVDSNSMNNLKTLIGIEPDTPIGEMYDKTLQALEFGAFGKIFEYILPIIKSIKNARKSTIEQVSTAVGGGTLAGTVVSSNINNKEEIKELEKITTVDEDKIREEKKTLNFEDQSSNQSMMEMFYGLDKTQQQKISEATGYPMDQIQQAGLIPVFKSILKETAKKLPAKGNGEQFLGQLKNTPGLKQQELKWSGLNEFLKGKKNVTKQEVQDYLKATSLDVAEVKFATSNKAAMKLTDELEFAKNDFESKWLNNYYKKNPSAVGEVEEELLEMVDYDNFNIVLGGDPGKMSFSDLATILGRDPKIGNMTVLKNGNLSMKMTDNPKSDVFEISELDFMKYRVEDAMRSYKKLSGKSPKFERFTEKGGEDYTELVFKIKQGGMDVGIPYESKWQKRKPKGYEGEVGFISEKGTAPFKSVSHMNVKSEIAHVRFKTRDLNGLKVLSVEEMQSDFAMKVMREIKQKTKFDRFKNLQTDFPFKNTWYELTVKRLIRYAADNGFDAVAIPKGSVAANRYGASIDKFDNLKIIIERKPKGKTFMDADGKTVLNNTKDNFIFTVHGLKDKAGVFSEIAQNDEIYKILKNYKAPNDLKNTIDEVLSGKFMFNESNELITANYKIPEKVIGSGAGKFRLYDQAIPSFMKKYGKKWNAKVYDDIIETGSSNVDGNEITIPVTIIKLTPEMKKSVQQDSQVLFNIFGLGVGAKIASDSIENNIISNKTEN
tara:strand:+ start:3517 stop:6231 length:2715 start_codon:yes stop_codon:yes gene_type:complete